MRIITGTLKGRTIRIPKTLEVRPTSDRTKEGLFGVIDARKYIREASVLDLFAGSGNLGLEAISRGAARVLFVDSDRRNIEHIESLSEEFGVADRCRAVTSTAEGFLEGPPAPYDFIFCDPPYEYPLMHEMVETILEKGWLQSRGWLILEHDKHHDFSGHPRFLQQKPYGRTIVSFFEAEEETP